MLTNLKHAALAGFILVVAGGCGKVIELPADARGAAERQFELLDSGQYDLSWREASPIFRAAVEEADWLIRAGAVRAPLGKFVGRVERNAVGKTDPANSPAGEYILITYDAAFEHRREGLVETMVLYQDEDHAWRMAGYFVK